MQTIKHFFKNLYHTIHLTTPVAIILGAIILASSHITYGFLMNQSTGTKPQVESFKGRAIDSGDLLTGNAKSNILIVEYSDTECPFCAQVYPAIEKIKQDYAGKIGFVYRYFPLVEIHPHAFEEARAVYCVGKELGAKKREDYLNEIFTYKLSKRTMVFPEGGKEDLAKNVGVNVQEFNACMKSDESSNAINASRADGIAAGVDGTPATFVLLKKRNGYEVVSRISGARPYEYFKAVIDEALSR